MALTDLRSNTLNIVNEVMRKLGLSAVTTLTSSQLTRVLVRFLNETIEECSNFGDWQEAFKEVNVTAQSSVGTYEIKTSGATLVKNIYEIHWNNDVAPLEVREIQDMRRLQRLASFGTPRQFAVVGVNASSGNPNIRVYPVPTTAAAFDVAFYEKPRLIDATVTANTTAIPIFPSNVLIAGVYAKALLEENGGEPTREYEVAYQEYLSTRQEALNRFNADTGTDIYIVPTGGRW